MACKKKGKGKVKKQLRSCGTTWVVVNKYYYSCQMQQVLCWHGLGGTLGNVKFFTKSIKLLLWEMAEWSRHLTVNQGYAGSNPVLPAN